MSMMWWRYHEKKHDCFIIRLTFLFLFKPKATMHFYDSPRQRFDNTKHFCLPGIHPTETFIRCCFCELVFRTVQPNQSTGNKSLFRRFYDVLDNLTPKILFQYFRLLQSIAGLAMIKSVKIMNNNCVNQVL